MQQKHYIEHWPEAQSLSAIAGEIARHLQVRQSLGSAVIVAKRPAILLSAVRKHWMKLARSLQSESARTLDSSLRAALANELEYMNTLRFVAKSPLEAPEADVFFVSTDTILDIPEACRTIYADLLPTSEDFGRFLTQAPAESVIVNYCLKEKE